MKDRWYYWRGDTLFLKVHISPQSRHSKIAGISNHRLHIKLNAPATEGKANKQLIVMLADEFKTGKSCIKLSAGARGRDKLVSIAGPRCVPIWFTTLAG